MPSHCCRWRLVAALAAAPLALSTSVVTFDAPTLAAVAAARRLTAAHVTQFQREHGVVVRGVMQHGAPPLARLGNPSPTELPGVMAEMRLAAALTSRLLDADALRDPFGAWYEGWDNAYDHYAFWRMYEEPPERIAMVIIAREALCLTLCGYPESVVSHTAYSSTSYPKVWCGSDLGARTDLAEPEITLDPGDALVLDGTNSEGLGGLGGGHLVYRFEVCDVDSDAVLWTRNWSLARAAGHTSDSDVAALPDASTEHQAQLLQDFVVARDAHSL